MSKNQVTAELAALADYFAGRREAILAAWGRAVEADPKLSAAARLSRTQFNDHIPSVLNALERELRRGNGAKPSEAEEGVESAAEHGLHRWHHGYNQEEVMREWGHLHLCLLNELENYVTTGQNLNTDSVRSARLAVARLCNDGVVESAVRYAHLQQAEAASRLRDLERTLAHLQRMEHERATAWREAAHDLRNKVGIVDTVSATLNRVPEQVRAEYVTMLQESVASLRTLLNDLAILGRLEAGHEKRNLQTSDVAVTLRQLCATIQPLASERNLFLNTEGPTTLSVQGDAVKIQRVAQNLILNAIQYTERGGVKVSWNAVDREGLEQWELCVQDTGPGFQHASPTPLTQALKEATEEAQTVEEQSEQTHSSAAQAQPAPTLPSQSIREHANPERGEGIGLSIVKRICELLDASLELQTDIGKGSMFRVTFPRRYDTGPESTST